MLHLALVIFAHFVIFFLIPKHISQVCVEHLGRRVKFTLLRSSDDCTLQNKLLMHIQLFYII